MPVVVGNDAARGGWAWCVADTEGPVTAGWVAVAHLRSPWVALARYVETVYRPLLVGLVPQGLVVVVEEPGLQVGRVNRRRQASAAAEQMGGPRLSDGAGAAGKIAFGQGLAVGSVLLTAGAVGVEPETVTPGAWRKTWGIRGAREACKEQAGLLVSRLYPQLQVGVATWAGGLAVERLPLSRLTAAQRSDVAEAVLIAVGRAQQNARAAHLPLAKARGRR